MGPEDQSTGYFLPLEDVLQRKQGMIQCIIRAVLFNQLKREFGWDLLSSLGLQDIRFWVRDFAYHIPSEEAAVGTKSGSSLYSSCRVTFVFIHLSASVPFRRIAAQPFLPRWVTRECITITCITYSCSLSSSALWSIGNAVLASLTHLFPTPCIKCIFNYVGRKSHSETGNLPMHSFSAADLLQSHEDSLCPLEISPHLELITFFPE